MTYVSQACLPFKFAVVFNFNVFPFPPSKLEGNDRVNRKIHQIGTWFFSLSHNRQWILMHRIILGYIYWRRNTHYPSFSLLYISLSLYLDSLSFLHLPISTSTSPFPSPSPSPSPSSSIKHKIKIIQSGGPTVRCFLPIHWNITSNLCFTRRKLKYILQKDDSKIKRRKNMMATVWGFYQTNATFPSPPAPWFSLQATFKALFDKIASSVGYTVQCCLPCCD